MKKILILSVIFAAGFALCGCETTQPKVVQINRTSAVIHATKDQVWPLLVQEIGMNWPVKIMDKDSGLITTDFALMPAGFDNVHMGRWVVEPSSVLRRWGGLRLAMRIMVVELEPAKTQVTMNFDYYALDTGTLGGGWIPCRSNGALENRILSDFEAVYPPKVAAQVPEVPPEF